jgi:hypothetical protein
MILTRSFSLTNFFIGGSALAFQIFILYPWHEQLQEDFKKMQAENIRTLKETEQARLEELSAIKHQLSLLQARKRWI